MRSYNLLLVIAILAAIIGAIGTHHYYTTKPTTQEPTTQEPTAKIRINTNAY